MHDNDSMIVLSVVLLEMSFNTRPLSMAAHVNAESGLCYGLCLLTLVCGPSYPKGQVLVLLKVTAGYLGISPEIVPGLNTL